uniref:Uncharacterized protein n=1 Tax=Alexandrium catenella TaxID=2925 RepID=A0A7S1MN98_ALECA|mmetsp:Transcript_3023/g.8155  ORF Transcript_3023/g.8155 Transcript_3023/m.8155 type:complete len:636 (+) Transcript_3023:66-1973(+)|eukprot:CAMPEP_0171198504 /NCGR_PEP_ID=MMETSP0790-20130122/22976_1 /TAXON_ID=2925 /ORGANISM="Alexandrium catenella, Strain OF101" /LENGTH=635 /DNA_ID=CAMNT_0011663809 /DNA_START=66 /DNA_END=1973 /DNA_ORIENTATION=-
MFRASDIFGRKAGAEPDKVLAKAKAEPSQKRMTPGMTRTWDPATGRFYEEELPADLQELMGMKKKVKTEMAKPEQDDKQAWIPKAGSSKPARVLGPASVGLKARMERQSSVPGAPAGYVDTTAPSVEYRGFSKVDLNERYYERPEVKVNGRITYWCVDSTFFIYWQGEVQRWSICDGASFPAVKAGQLPGWAYKGDHRHLCQASGWMEAWNGEWREPELEVTFRSASHHKPQWEDVLVQKSIAQVEFHGFTMRELNTTYYLRPDEIIQGRPSYWDTSGVYFIYWQNQTQRWAICDLKCMDAVRDGQCPGWAYRSDTGHFANACGWMEMRANQWVDAIVETAIIGASTKGLKVEFSGFNKDELNTQFIEKGDEEIQGRVTYWDLSGTYFIYWQSSMKRWAICDKVSLQPAKKGLAPGWAYRTDSQHFAKASSGWVESWGREWRPVAVTCMVLEGSVRDTPSMVKQEVKEEAEETKGEVGTLLSVDQYHTLVKKVYEEKNPGKMPDVPYLLEKYKGKEHELFRQVCEKYEVDPDELAADLPAPTEAQADSKEAVDEFAHLENEAMPELSAGEYAVLVQNVYEVHNPKKLMDIARLLAKYRGRERELFHDVCNKYSVHPAKFHARQLRDRQAEAVGGN